MTNFVRCTDWSMMCTRYHSTLLFKCYTMPDSNTPSQTPNLLYTVVSIDEHASRKLDWKFRSVGSWWNSNLGTSMDFEATENMLAERCRAPDTTQDFQVDKIYCLRIMRSVGDNYRRHRSITDLRGCAVRWACWGQAGSPMRSSFCMGDRHRLQGFRLHESEALR